MERCVSTYLQTNNIMSRYDQIVKHIKNALKEEHLYSDEELKFMKSQLRTLQETKSRILMEERGGFGS